jgi:hypothetical protein
MFENFRKKKELEDISLDDEECDDEKTGVGDFITSYIKNAWQGKVDFLGLFFVWAFASKIPEMLWKATESNPVLKWPIAILWVSYYIWLGVSIWRCAFNGMRWKWIGYATRLFFVILPIAGYLTWLGFYTLQQVTVGVECMAAQRDYTIAVTGKAGSEYISDKKSALDACNARYAPCKSDPKNCFK